MDDATASELNKSGSGGSERGGGEDKDRGIFEFFGWVYHLGVNSIGREYCHLRFLFIRGKYVSMYKRDPHENHAIVGFFSFFTLLYYCILLINTEVVITNSEECSELGHD